jgi:magnesium chelatase subunit D
MVDYDGDKKASHLAPGLAFEEIVGQAELKRALLAVAANDELDGLLVRGEKGTAKSTAVRALAELLPARTAVADCPYGCPPDDPAAQCADCRGRADPPTVERSVPLVTLPLGATRERVVGTLSVADALDGDHEFDPGLLARANRGILYVDEVNLLDDHLVDVLLDAAAGGVNRVERDGVSVRHPAAFTLVGTMNPEEGELRPQLRDRFALQATVTGCRDLEDRTAIIDRALGRSTPAASGDGDGDAGRSPRERLLGARERLGSVTLSASFVEEIAQLCRDAGVEGHRADIATARAARTLAALDGRETVLQPDVERAAGLALPHRLQSRPFDDAPDPGELIDDQFGDGGDEEDGETDPDDGDGEDASAGPDSYGEPDDPEGDSDDTPEGESGRQGEAPDGSDDPDPEPAGAPEREEGSTAESGSGEDAGDDGAGDPDGGEDPEERTPLAPGEAPAGVGDAGAPELSAPEALEGGRAGRANAAPGVDGDGPRVRSRPADSDGRVDAAASVRAAAARGGKEVRSRDLRESVRQGEASALVVFAVDASASMRPAMRAAKGTVLELLEDAYQQRDEVAFVAFAGEGAEVLLAPTDSVTLAARHLKELPTGDRTPLPAGLRTAGELLDRADPDAGVVVLVTDGRANVADGSPVGETRAATRELAATGARVVVVDAGDGRGLTEVIAGETDGRRVPLSALSAERVDAAVGAARGER